MSEIAGVVLLSGNVISRLTYVRLAEVDGMEQFVKGVMEAYHAMPDDVRRDPDSEAYRAVFREYEEDPVYDELRMRLTECQTGYLLEDISLVVYDPDTSAMVYVVDANASDYVASSPVGFSKTVEEELTKAFSDDSGTLETEIEIESEITDEQIIEAFINEYVNGSSNSGRSIVSGYPVRDDQLDVYCYVLVEVPVLLAHVTAVVYTIIYLVVLLVITILIVVISRKLVKRRVIMPILKITKAAELYAQDRVNGDTSNARFGDLNIRTKDELQDLSQVMSEMEFDLSRYEQDLMKATAEQERIQTELNLAAGIQDSMLPSDFPAFPDRTEFEIFASMDPAKEVGGDFYDYFLIDEDHLALVIADVSGKGIPAALFMMTSKIILNNFASMGLSPKEILTQANEKICNLSLKNMFVTVWLGILDLRTGVVTAGNAGHEYPVIRQKGGRFELMHDRHNLVIGAMRGVKYGEYTFTLQPGSTLFLYTDGVPEANISEENMYGTDRMLDALNRADSYDPTVLLPAIRKDVDAFVRNEPQFDDLTMLSIYYRGPAANEAEDEAKTEAREP